MKSGEASIPVFGHEHISDTDVILYLSIYYRFIYVDLNIFSKKVFRTRCFKEFIFIFEIADLATSQ